MSFPARIHALLAGDAPVGVVIRRGPSKSVCVVGWDRDKDQFRLGQWMKGRIYERRCDLSPDGRHLIYFAMNGSRAHDETKGAWTAISRAPYLKELVLFAKGDCWHGGGLFTGSGSYWLNDGYGHDLLRDSVEVRRDFAGPPTRGPGGECLSVYYPRLLRDGWRFRAPPAFETSDETGVFDKALPQGWVLRKLAHQQIYSPAGKGCYWDEHQLVNAGLGACIPFPTWEWAEWDRDRLVWAEAGILWTGSVTREGLQNGRSLFDFNDMSFDDAAPY